MFSMAKLFYWSITIVLLINGVNCSAIDNRDTFIDYISNYFNRIIWELNSISRGTKHRDIYRINVDKS